MMDGFMKRTEQKRKNIILATLQLFQRFGVQKVTIAEIAKKANVSQVTIYNYFSSKENLIQIVFQYYVDQMWKKQKRIIESDLPFEEKMTKLMFNKESEAEVISSNFFQDFMINYAGEESYVEKLYVQEVLPSLIKLFNDGRKQGVVDKSISDEAIIFYLEMFRKSMQQEGAEKNILPLADDLTKLFFYGITGKKKDEQE